MATLIKWPLDQVQLRLLSAEFSGKIYCTGFQPGMITELTVTDKPDNVRPWLIPSPLLSNPLPIFNPLPIIYGPENIPLGVKREVWLALENQDHLLLFQPETGKFAAYGNVAGSLHPFFSPRQIRFDRDGKSIWYVGLGRPVPCSIGKLNPVTQRVASWDLPPSIWDPGGLWIDGRGFVWISITNLNTSGKGPGIARLDPLKNEVIQIELSTGVPPYFPEIVTDRRGENAWFTGEGSVFRFNLSSHTCFSYDYLGNPSKILLDEDGNAWMTDDSNGIGMIDRNANCGTVPVTLSRITPERRAAAVKEWTAQAAPTLFTSVSSQSSVTSAQSGCVTAYDVTPCQGLALKTSPIAGKQRQIYFAAGEGSSSFIGVLSP